MQSRARPHRPDPLPRADARGMLCRAASVGAALLLAASGGTASGEQPQGGRYPNPRQRERALEWTAALRAKSFASVAARLRLGRDTALAWRQLDTLVSAPTGDIFWTYPAATFYFTCRDLLSDAWRRRFRTAWKLYTPYRGDTENHFLMYYGAILLFSQEWPDLSGSDWFNGKSSRENYAEAADYFDHWIDETSRLGMSEWDSPRYMYFYITPLATLAQYTADPRLRSRFGMMLEYMLADYAGDYLAGSYCGAHARDGDGSVIDPRGAEATAYGEFFFEDFLSHPLPDLAFVAMMPFHAPAIIADIAHDRSKPSVELELKRSRAKIRNAEARFSTVRKYTYITRDYALGSIEGGVEQPIQQHTWGLTFAAERPNNTIFALHPNASATEMGMFFPEEPELMVAGVLHSKASYGSGEKWIGGSPYERIFQYRSTLVGLYDIPASALYHHVDFYLPKSLDTLIRDGSGWIICRMGSAFAGIRLLQADSVTWIEEPANWRLRVVDPRARYAVECASASTMRFEEFVRRLRQAPDPLAAIGETLRYRSPFGPELAMPATQSEGGRGLVVDGIPTPPTHRLFDSPNIESELGRGVITLRCNGRTRVLDFVNNRIR